jgi:hypothetical protein
MNVRKGILKSFSAGSYTATVQLSGSDKVYLDEIAVVRNIPSGEMVSGRNLVLVFFDEHNSKEAIVMGVYTG